MSKGYKKFTASDDAEPKGSVNKPGIASESPRKGMLKGKAKKKAGKKG